LTDYGLHLREKQKVKHYYGVLNASSPVFPLAERARETPARRLMRLLERRLDNVLFALGFGQSGSSSGCCQPRARDRQRALALDVPSYQTTAHGT